MYASSPAWLAIGASVEGALHLVNGTGCQDAHEVRTPTDDVLVICVADGAGSASRSAEGAQAAVAAAADWLTNRMLAAAGDTFDDATWAEIMRTAFEMAKQATFALAAKEGESAREFAATLTCLVAMPGAIACGMVGDGVVVAETAPGAFATLLAPRRGEYANETDFLISAGGLDRLQVAVERRPVSTVMASTDGLLRVMMDLSSMEPHPPFFTPLTTFIATAADPEVAQQQLAGFLTSERINARTDDDKTLVVARALHEAARQLSAYTLPAPSADELQPDTPPPTDTTDAEVTEAAGEPEVRQ